jgi:hypothetical protein
MDRKLCVLQSHSGHCGLEKELPLQGTDSRPFSPSLVSVPFGLSWLIFLFSSILELRNTPLLMYFSCWRRAHGWMPGEKTIWFVKAAYQVLPFASCDRRKRAASLICPGRGAFRVMHSHFVWKSFLQKSRHEWCVKNVVSGVTESALRCCCTKRLQRWALSHDWTWQVTYPCVYREKPSMFLR